MWVDFDRRLKLEFYGSKLTSDGGFLAYWELNDAPGLTKFAGDVFHDSRSGENGWHGMTGQIRKTVFGRLGGYEDVNDAEHPFKERCQVMSELIQFDRDIPSVRRRISV